MIFTHGFVLANVVLEDAFSLFLALSDREFLTEKSFLDHLLNRFREMDVDDTGGKWHFSSLAKDICNVAQNRALSDTTLVHLIINRMICPEYT